MELQTDTEVVKKVMDLAKKQFQEKKYNACLRLYTRAISYSQSLDQTTIKKLRVAYGLTERPSYADKDDRLYHPKLATLLDNRAAVLEKLKKNTDALADANDMIRVEPYNPRGYLRAGKLLQLLNQDRKAHETYTKGLMKFEQGKKDHKMKLNQHLVENLTDQRDLLKRKILKEKKPTSDSVSSKKGRVVSLPAVETRPSKKLKVEPTEVRIDPFTVLPAELILHTLQMLSMKTVLRCRQVCKSWEHVVASLPLYNHLRFSEHIGGKDLSNCLQLALQSKQHSSHRNVSSVVIPSMRVAEEKQIINLLLVKSKISLIGTLDISFLNSSMQLLVDVLNASANAQRVVAGLKTLQLKCEFTPTYETELLNHLPNLEKITIIPAPFKRQPALPKSYTPPASVFNNLTSLTIIGDINGITKRYPSIPFRHFFTREGSAKLPNLATLAIVGYDFADLNSHNHTYNFLVNFPRLKNLVFENNKGYNFRTLLMSHDLLPFQLSSFTFREREIRYVEGLQLFETVYLQNIFGNMGHLDLTGSSMSFQGLHRLLSLCGWHIKHLAIGMCGNIAFKRGPFAMRMPQGGFFDFDEFVRLCPIIEVLYLNQSTDFGDYAIGEMEAAIKKRTGFTLLRVLDLSFNNGISGYKLLDLVKVLKLEKLMLHAVEIQQSTLKLMEYKYVYRVESKLDKQYWKEYGVNSYNPF